MLDPILLLIIVVSLLLLVMLVFMFLLYRKVQQITAFEPQQLRSQLLAEFQQSEMRTKQGFTESRRDFREMNAENRLEINQSFKGLQDTLLQRVAENSAEQHRQLSAFRTALTDLSDKLINHSNEFKQAVTISLQTASAATTTQQEQFSEKTINRLSGFQDGMKKDSQENRKEMNEGLNAFAEKFNEGIKSFNEQLRIQFSDLNRQQQEANEQSKRSINEIKDSIDKQLKTIREDNNQQLNEMRKTVDEKLHETLEKRLGESFKLVSDRLELVHKGLGEMQNLAVGVGDLKKVLSNVKTRGILGEYQLGNILEQTLSPEQYETNVATKKGSQANVEYAVKLPGKSDEKTVWLPIDSKFPLESYTLLLQALEEGDTVRIEQAQKQLLKTIESFAKEISTKYIDPPHTTDFGIMFLPVESLYAEVLRYPETFEKLQRTYRITITGPTTLSALLNSLHMGFRTLAVQKRSSEVWKVLSEVKTEFNKYGQHLEKVQKYLHNASSSLDDLQTTRTNVMQRKLRGVEALGHEDLESPTLSDTPQSEI